MRVGYPAAREREEACSDVEARYQGKRESRDDIFASEGIGFDETADRLAGLMHGGGSLDGIDPPDEGNPNVIIDNLRSLDIGRLICWRNDVDRQVERAGRGA